MINNIYTKFTSVGGTKLYEPCDPIYKSHWRKKTCTHTEYSLSHTRTNMLKYMANAKHKNLCHHYVPPT